MRVMLPTGLRPRRADLRVGHRMRTTRARRTICGPYDVSWTKEMHYVSTDLPWGGVHTTFWEAYLDALSKAGGGGVGKRPSYCPRTRANEETDASDGRAIVATCATRST